MSVTIKGLLLSLGVMALIASQVCWAYRLPCPDEKEHHLSFKVDVPTTETCTKVLTAVESTALDLLPQPLPSPPQHYDCDNDVYDNDKHHDFDYKLHIGPQYEEPRPGFLQKYVLNNDEQC